VVSPACKQYDSVRAGMAFAAGEGALMWNWIGFALAAEQPGSAVRGRVGLAPLPRGDGRLGRRITLNTYWVLVIPAAAKNPEGAWRLIRHLATPAMDRVTAESGGHAVRLSTWRDPGIQSRFPPYAVVERLHEDAVALPAIAEYPRVNAVLNQMMASALAGANVERLLNEAASEVGAILARR
jgi:multiple sugar transport system substrate-binding protein